MRGGYPLYGIRLVMPLSVIADKGRKEVIVKNLMWIFVFVTVAVLMWQLPFLLRVFRWLVIDIYRFFTTPRKIHLFGIWLYCGLYGQGKTMALTEYLVRMRKKYSGNKSI